MDSWEQDITRRSCRWTIGAKGLVSFHLPTMMDVYRIGGLKKTIVRDRTYLLYMFAGLVKQHISLGKDIDVRIYFTDEVELNRIRMDTLWYTNLAMESHHLQ